MSKWKTFEDEFDLALLTALVVTLAVCALTRC